MRGKCFNFWFVELRSVLDKKRGSRADDELATQSMVTSRTAEVVVR